MVALLIFSLLVLLPLLLLIAFWVFMMGPDFIDDLMDQYEEWTNLIDAFKNRKK